jgi:hypothetical protein
MDLSLLLQQKYNKQICAQIVSWVGDSAERFDELFGLFVNGNNRVTQMATWPISYCIQHHPHLLKNKYAQLLQIVQQPKIHPAIKRNTIRLLQFVSIPKKYHGQVMDICFTCVATPKEPVAIKAFALTVLGNLATHYPDIIPEIQLLIEDQLPHQTPAFKHRAKQFLQKHDKGL